MFNDKMRNKIKEHLAAAMGMLADAKGLEKHVNPDVSDIAHNAVLHLRVVINDWQKLLEMSQPVLVCSEEVEALIAESDGEASADAYRAERELIDAGLWADYVAQVEREKVQEGY